MYAQIIDDTVGHTLVAASTVEKEVKAELANTDTVEAAAYVGTVIAKRAIEKGIKDSRFRQRRFHLSGQDSGTGRRSPRGWSGILVERRIQHEAYNH